MSDRIPSAVQLRGICLHLDRFVAYLKIFVDAHTSGKYPVTASEDIIQTMHRLRVALAQADARFPYGWSDSANGAIRRLVELTGRQLTRSRGVSVWVRLGYPALSIPRNPSP